MLSFCTILLRDSTFPLVVWFDLSWSYLLMYFTNKNKNNLFTKDPTKETTSLLKQSCEKEMNVWKVKSCPGPLWKWCIYKLLDHVGSIGHTTNTNNVKNRVTSSGVGSGGGGRSLASGNLPVTPAQPVFLAASHTTIGFHCSAVSCGNESSHWQAAWESVLPSTRG